MYGTDIYHLNDRTMKYLSMAQAKRQHQYLGLPGKFKTRLPQEVVFPNMDIGRADEYYLTDIVKWTISKGLKAQSYILENNEGEEAIREAIALNADNLIPKSIVVDDIFIYSGLILAVCVILSLFFELS